MTLAIFDLDNTLLAGDSDYLWGEYMVANRIVDEKAYRERNREFFHQYQRGELDNERYLEFALEPLSRYSLGDLHRWRSDFVENWIKPIVAPGAAELLGRHRRQAHEMLIISATNLFITEPIAELLDIPTVLSTRPEISDGRYTGRYLGTPTYREGKVTVLREWMAERGHGFTGSYCYTDSINDIALLERVENPVAVNPDDDLKAISRSRGWPIIDLRR